MLNLPYVADQLSPVLILLSGVITLGILNNNNELLALKAAGIPLRKIIRPILIGSVIATVLFILAAQLLLPKTIAVTNDIWFEQVRGKVPLGIFRNGRYYFKGSEGFYSFQWTSKEKMIFKDFSYSTWDENYNIKVTRQCQIRRLGPTNVGAENRPAHRTRHRKVHLSQNFSERVISLFLRHPKTS